MAYSYSRLETYRQCPRKYKFQYVDMVPNKQSAVYLLLGQRVHEAIEKNDISLVMSDSVALELFRRGRQHLEDLQYTQLEEKIAIDEEGNPVGFEDPKALLRGVIDVLGPDYILDWKTGYTECTPMQLSIYALLAKAHGYDIERVGYCMLRKDKKEWMTLTSDMLECAKEYLISTISGIENETLYTPVLNDYCQYCPYAEQCVEVKQEDATRGQALLHQLSTMESTIKQIKKELKEIVQEKGDIQVGDKIYGASSTIKPRCSDKKALTVALNEAGILGDYGEVASGIYCRLLDEHPEFSDYFKNAIVDSIGFKEVGIA